MMRKIGALGYIELDLVAVNVVQFCDLNDKETGCFGETIALDELVKKDCVLRSIVISCYKFDPLSLVYMPCKRSREKH